MPEIASISLSDLLIDTQNPRLEQPNTGQREALRAFAADQKGKLVALAKDVVAYGLNPSELPIVMPFHDDLKRYVVLEGNRRLTVLKALENPEWLVGAMQHTEVEEMRRLSKEYQEDPIESVQCVVVQTRDEAQHWMLIRHAPKTTVVYRSHLGRVMTHRDSVLAQEKLIFILKPLTCLRKVDN